MKEGRGHNLYKGHPSEGREVWVLSWPWWNTEASQCSWLVLKIQDSVYLPFYLTYYFNVWRGNLWFGQNSRWRWKTAAATLSRRNLETPSLLSNEFSVHTAPEKFENATIDHRSIKKSNVVSRGLYSYRQRYASSQWSKCTTNFDQCDDAYRCQ